MQRLPAASAPGLLVSFAYLPRFEKLRKVTMYRDWALDSGAFTAYTLGKPVDLSAYIEKCHQLLETDPTLVEIFALDVIGDHEASLQNALAMRAAGINAVPAFHYGEPWSALEHLASEFPKIALGGVAKMHQKRRRKWLEQCFARVWPKKIHGFGISTRALVLGLPFHSVDSTSWELGPCRFGTWRSFGQLSIKGSRQDLRSEVEWHLRLEREARSKWAREMAILETLGAE